MGPRTARHDILYDGCYAHVISRSIREMTLFYDDEDFESFYQLLKYVKTKMKFEVFHYCLMQTHFHLVVGIGRASEFSKAIQYLKSQYSYKYHTKYHLSGPIWRERYRGLLIEDERYLRACGKYIENNPVKAGLAETAEDWKYSSHRFYQGKRRQDIIDGYDMAEDFKDEIDIDLEEEEFFEKGQVIGSSLFRFQFSEYKKRR